MKRFFLFILLGLILLPAPTFGWGKTGHRVVGEIAERHLTRKARKNIRKVLGHHSLAMVSNWMDFIKSDPAYNHMYPWHYTTIPNGKTYEEVGPVPEGDIIVAIERMMEELRTKQFSEGDEAFVLRCLVHLVGDIHQPLHVGIPGDRGGNDVKVSWFGNETNLHAVWDSRIIDDQQLSYTEYADHLDHIAPDQVRVWQAATVRDWAHESMTYRETVYNIPEDRNLRFRYIYDNLATVELRLQQAGIRLAGMLNAIYG